VKASSGALSFYPILGCVLAIAITATMDANGLTTFSALPLIPLGLGLWALQRLSRVSVGLTLGRPVDYVLALAYPAIVLGAGAAIAILSGASSHVGGFFGTAAIDRILISALAGIVAVLLTEEGFFRGWLWASLAPAKIGGSYRVLIVTSVAFAVWHISYATLAKGFILPPAQVAIFIANAGVMGAIWGLLRFISGSILVSSVSHSVWNAIAYALFGEGPKIGLLGVTQTSLFGAEVGVIGLALNCAFALALLVLLALYRKRSTSATVAV
jgi:membrane protease YdiL (CAAX protease family)